MVCLLCYECSGDLISISSAEGDKSKISSVLFKYFHFIFESEPLHGEICRECWMKVDTFHAFYQRIEEIQVKIVKLDPLVTEHIDLQLKLEDTPDNKKSTSFFSSDADTNNDCDADNDFWQDEYTTDAKEENVRKNQSGSRKPNTQNKTDQECTSRNKSKRTKKKESKVCVDVKITANPDAELHTCPINRKCIKKFQSKDELIAHASIEHRRFHCTHCPNTRLFADLYKHLRDIHGIIENAICEHCGQIFGCNRTLQEHIKRKHTVSDPVQCDICKEWFKSRETIRSHMNYVHIQGTQTCSICGKISANRKALRTHLTIHSERWKDKFKCVICGKGFRSSTKLREHSYIHSGKTDAYICQFCGKSFRFNSSISAHRMKHHPAEMAHVKERLQRKRNMEFKV